jgi:hypothetical protein
MAETAPLYYALMISRLVVSLKLNARCQSQRLLLQPLSDSDHSSSCRRRRHDYSQDSILMSNGHNIRPFLTLVQAYVCFQTIRTWRRTHKKPI